ncbi:hypothetical protein D3C78_1751030 [compost metagenome]
MSLWKVSYRRIFESSSSMKSSCSATDSDSHRSSVMLRDLLRYGKPSRYSPSTPPWARLAPLRRAPGSRLM